MDVVESKKRVLQGRLASARAACVSAGTLLLIAFAFAAKAETGADQIGEAVRSEIAAGHVPGVVVVVGVNGRTVYRKGFGIISFGPKPEPMKPDAIFDLASLTKVVATTTSVMQLVEAGRLGLDAPVSTYWPRFASNGKATITVRELLTHTSGLRPDIVPSAHWSGTGGALAMIAADHPVAVPGSHFLYSDLNFIVLGELVRRLSGQPLDAYAKKHIFTPLAMRDTVFDPEPAERTRIVPTDRQDGALRWGRVQDPTAYRMGGVAGHAGLFSSADDLAKFAQMLLDGGTENGRCILNARTVAEMTAPGRLSSQGSRGLGWDINSPYSAGMNAVFGPHSFGHTGYTGTFLWLDPDTHSFVIILTSRLYPNDRGDARMLRAKVARAAFAMIQHYSSMQ